MLPINVPPNFRIIAHRGASAYRPENTVTAFKLALQMNVTEIELDTQLTTDGVVVLCHDSSLVRYGHGDHNVESMSWSELASLDMGSWFSPYLFGGESMCTLDQLFSEFNDDFIYHVEIKGRHPDLPQAVLYQIEKHDLKHQCFITSFSYAALVAMRALDDQIRMGWLVRKMDEEVLEKAAALQLYQLCPFAGAVTAESVTHARQIVPEVRAWGLLGETTQGQSAEVMALIQNVLDAGCNGVTINWPDWLAHEPPRQ